MMTFIDSTFDWLFTRLTVVHELTVPLLNWHHKLRVDKSPDFLTIVTSLASVVLAVKTFHVMLSSTSCTALGSSYIGYQYKTPNIDLRLLQNF